MQSRTILLMAIAPALLLSACTAPPTASAEAAEFELTITPETTLQELEVEIHAALVNPTSRTLVVTSPTDCLRAQVHVRTATGMAIPLEGPADTHCRQSPTQFRIGAGEQMEWGPIPFRASEWQGPQGEPHFPPGNYIVEASLELVDGELRAAAPLPVLEGELPRIEILPEVPQWRQGQERNITLRLSNTAPVAYHWTSENDCKDIELRVQTTQVRLWPHDGPTTCTDTPTAFTLEPGEQLTQVVVWDASMDGQGGAPYVPPGDHRLEASLGAQHADWRVDATQLVTITENE